MVFDLDSLDPSWSKELKDEFKKPYFLELKKFLSDEYKAKNIFPKAQDIFRAFNLTPLSNLKVVILGQDPYHGEGQGHGLSFSVQKGVKLPPSLKNIFKELKSDLGLSPPTEGDLTNWAREGVLLLNTILSVEEEKPGSHRNRGWEIFTSFIIDLVNKKKEKVAFILWGSHAHRIGESIDHKKHFIIKSPHPSPLSSHRGFFGSKPFSQANSFLEEHGKIPVDWSL